MFGAAQHAVLLDLDASLFDHEERIPDLALPDDVRAVRDNCAARPHGHGFHGRDRQGSERRHTSEEFKVRASGVAPASSRWTRERMSWPTMGNRTPATISAPSASSQLTSTDAAPAPSAMATALRVCCAPNTRAMTSAATSRCV